MLSIDKARYYDKVLFCCCYKDYVIREEGRIYERMVDFNLVLEDEFKIRKEEYPIFLDYYRKYRMWLVEHFISPYYSFSPNDYIDVLSRKRRKEWKNWEEKTKKFQEIFGVHSEEKLFFAQSFYSFSYDISVAGDEIDRKVVAHKMVLGAIKMLVLIGYASLEWYMIEEEKKIKELKFTKNDSTT